MREVEDGTKPGRQRKTLCELKDASACVVTRYVPHNSFAMQRTCQSLDRGTFCLCVGVVTRCDAVNMC